MVALPREKPQWSDHWTDHVRPRSDHPSPDRRISIRLDADTHAALMDVPRGQRSAAIKRLIDTAQAQTSELDSLRQMVAQQQAQIASLTQQLTALTTLMTTLVTGGNQIDMSNRSRFSIENLPAERLSDMSDNLAANEIHGSHPPRAAVRPGPGPAKPAVVVVDDKPATEQELASATGNFLNMFG